MATNVTAPAATAPPPTAEHEHRREVAATIRRLTAEWTLARDGGYLAQACGSAEILATLLTGLQLGSTSAPLLPDPFPGVPTPGDRGPQGSAWLGTGPDVLLISPAHYATAVYAGLVGTRRLAPAAMTQCSGDGGLLEMIGAEHSPGMGVTAGSLGTALAIGVGQAIARARLGRPGRVWVLLSDGETQEGATWEAVQLAAAQQLANLRVIVDRNRMQVDGAMAEVMPVTEPEERFTAFGWSSLVVDGHDLAALDEAMCRADDMAGPVAIICRTEPWRGFDLLKQRWLDSRLHFVRLTEQERLALRSALDVDQGSGPAASGVATTGVTR